MSDRRFWTWMRRAAFGLFCVSCFGFGAQLVTLAEHMLSGAVADVVLDIVLLLVWAWAISEGWRLEQDARVYLRRCP